MNRHDISRHFRERRMREFARILRISQNTRILDVGGTAQNWALLDTVPNVTLLNMPRASEPVPPGFEWVSASGCLLPFRDGEFDVVFSNSVIEHVGDSKQQALFAAEARRVGRSYWIQTPNRRAPVEAHLLMPFIHWLPPSWQRPIVERCTVWDLLERPSPERRKFYIEHYLNEIRLLDAAQFQALFPDAAIRRERVLGITKSLVALRIRP